MYEKIMEAMKSLPQFAHGKEQFVNGMHSGEDELFVNPFSMAKVRVSKEKEFVMIQLSGKNSRTINFSDIVNFEVSGDTLIFTRKEEFYLGS